MGAEERLSNGIRPGAGVANNERLNSFRHCHPSVRREMVEVETFKADWGSAVWRK